MSIGDLGNVENGDKFSSIRFSSSILAIEEGIISKPSHTGVSNWTRLGIHASIAKQKFFNELHPLEYKEGYGSPPFLARQWNTLQDSESSIGKKIQAGISFALVGIVSCWVATAGVISGGVIGGALGMLFLDPTQGVKSGAEWGAKVSLGIFCSLIGFYSAICAPTDSKELQDAVKSNTQKLTLTLPGSENSNNDKKITFSGDGFEELQKLCSELESLNKWIKQTFPVLEGEDCIDSWDITLDVQGGEKYTMQLSPIQIENILHSDSQSYNVTVEPKAE